AIGRGDFRLEGRGGRLALADAGDVLLDALAVAGAEERREGNAREAAVVAPGELGESHVRERDRALLVGDRDRDLEGFDEPPEVRAAHDLLARSELVNDAEEVVRRRMQRRLRPAH